MSDLNHQNKKASISPRIQPVIWVLLLFLANLPIFTRSNSEFDSVFKHYARVLASGGDIYHEGSPFMYPPWMATVTAPIAWMPHIPARIAWGIANMFFLWKAIRCAWNLSIGPNPTFSQSQRVKIAVSGLLCSATYFLNCISHQQFDVIIAGLIFWGLWEFSRSKPVISGILLGMGAACKMTPLLFLPYFIYRGYWKTTLTLLLTFVFCNFLPEALWGLPKDGIPRMAVFAKKTLAPLLDANFVPGTWGSEIIFNQSLAGLSKRWNQTKLEKVDGKVQVIPCEPRVGQKVTKLLLIGFVAGCGIFAIFCLGKPGGQNASLNSDSSMVLCGMLLLSPMSGLAHFGILLLPALNIANGTTTVQSRNWMVLFLILPLIGGVCLNKDLVGNNLYSMFLWYATATFATISLFLGNGLLSRQARKNT